METVTITLANEMVRRGHKVSVAYCMDEIAEEMPYNVDSRIKTVKLLDTRDCKAEDVEKLKNYIVENSIAIIINQHTGTKLCHEACLNTKCKLITCYHMAGYINHANMGKNYKQKIKRMLGPVYRFYDAYRQTPKHNEIYEMSDKYVFLCSGLAEEYKRISGNRDKENKLAFIYNAIEYKKFDINFSKKQKEVLWVGRVAEFHKRVFYILKIWKTLEDSGKYSNWHLTIVGNGEDLPSVKEYAQKLHLGNISFEGFQKPEKYYRRASVFLMTSEFEGLPMTLIESQSFGCVPVAMDSFASVRDIIDNGQNGFIVPNNDLNAFAEKVCQLMGNASLREDMARNGMESVKKFSVENIVDKWEELFKSMCNKEEKC
jgi:glycosyltransferase involved in cell wall biosynthesis